MKLRKLGLLLLVSLLISCFDVVMIEYLSNNPNYFQLNAYTWESEEFRNMDFGDTGIEEAKEFAQKYKENWLEVLTLAMVKNDYVLAEGDILNMSHMSYQLMLADIEKKKGPEFRKLVQAYGTVLSDLVYFPIPRPLNEDTPWVTYLNSWGAERTYGGERTHEGTDIMGDQMPRGHYPVVSVSAGTVEKIGWLEKGGWRIGIRTDSGAYLYYAHLYGYARDFVPGERVEAGELLGFMGDTGYSTIEGTTGNFEVHLHFGIYLTTDHNEEMSVNPYWILRYLERNTLKFSY